jgi:hypothetical protein
MSGDELVREYWRVIPPAKYASSCESAASLRSRWRKSPVRNRGTPVDTVEPSA